MKVAILDVDGTLHRGSVGLRALDAMMRRNECAPQLGARVLEPVTRYRRGIISHAEMVQAASAAYAVALAGMRREAVATIAAEVWSEERERLFPFARPLVEMLSRAGFVPFIMSSSPEEIIAHVAAELGVTDYRASRFSVVGGFFSGACEVMPGEIGGKERLLQAHFGERIVLSESFAIGNSPGDAGVLSRVGYPFVFEPDPELHALASERGWSVVDRHTVLHRVSEITGG